MDVCPYGVDESRSYRATTPEGQTFRMNCGVEASSFHWRSVLQPKHFECPTALTVLTVERMMTSVSPNRTLSLFGGALPRLPDKFSCLHVRSAAIRWQLIGLHGR
jgi:hypothetical protein